MSQQRPPQNNNFSFPQRTPQFTNFNPQRQQNYRPNYTSNLPKPEPMEISTTNVKLNHPHLQNRQPPNNNFRSAGPSNFPNRELFNITERTPYPQEDDYYYYYSNGQINQNLPVENYQSDTPEIEAPPTNFNHENITHQCDENVVDDADFPLTASTIQSDT